MEKAYRSYVHVVIQFGLIFYIALTGPLFASGILLAIEIAGISLALWAIWVMRRSYLSIFPEPDQSFKLIENGPYYLIRHPMYTSLFLALIPLVIEYHSLERILAIGIFIINQILKLLYEESLIKKQIPAYSDYMKRTKRIIPYLF